MTRPGSRMFAFLTLAAALSGCGRSEPKLQPEDLTSAESRYVERFVVLERARAVALVDSETGTALLDSLAAVWGDSALRSVQRELSDDPLRAAAVHNLLERILMAEQDSLINASRPDRLTAPLPKPVPATPSSAPEG